MKIEFCNEVPQKKRKSMGGPNLRLIERLTKSKELCMKLSFRSASEATSKANSLRTLVRDKHFPVRVMKRDNEVYLVKEEAK